MPKFLFSKACKGLISITTVLFCLKGFALMPYKYNWTKIKSSHFTVIVDEEYSTFGKLVLEKAEEAFSRLKVFTPKHPKNTIIVIDHTKGYSNGMATFFPYPQITLQPNLPDASASVGQYNDWLLELILHEYTHILSFHNTRNLFTPLRWVLGTTISPAYFLPTWYQEGIAVFTESHLTNGGRLRTSRYHAYKNQLQKSNISFANEQETGEYPYGSAPYIFGGWLNQDTLKNPPLEKIAKLHKKLSGRFPFFINGAYKSVAQKSLYKSWKELFNSKNKPSEKLLKRQGHLPFFDAEAEELYYVRLDPYLFDEIVVEKKGKTSVVVKDRSIISFKKTKDAVFYLSLQLSKQDHHIFSLKRYDFKTKKVKQISKVENVKSFDIWGDKILYVDSKINKQSLKLNNLDWSQEKILVSAGPESRLEFCRFLNANKVVYSEKKSGKNESVTELNLSTNSTKQIFSAEHILYLSKQNKSIWLLYENQSNKYLTSLNTKTHLHLKDEVLDFYPLEKEQVFTSLLTNKGNFIKKMKLDEIKSARPPRRDLPLANNSNKNDKLANLSIKKEDYSSFYKLSPHYIMPMFEYSPYGFSEEHLFGFSTGGKDPLELHSYQLSAFTDSISQEVSSQLTYTSRHFRMPWSLSGGVFHQPLSRNFIKKSTYGILTTQLPYSSSFSKNFNIKFQLHWYQSESLTVETKRSGAALIFSYSNTELRSRELAPRKGYSLQLRGEYNAPFSDYYDYFQGKFALRLYFTSPLQKKHRLIFGLDGGYYDRAVGLLFAENSVNQIYRSVPFGSFTLRGLPTGSLFANDFYATGHLEYRFPLFKINWGPGLLPGFLHRVTGALTADYGLAKGFDFNSVSLFDQNQALYSAGGEIIVEGKLFYHVPVSMQIGFYQFLNREFYDGGPEIFVGFGIGGLPI